MDVHMCICIYKRERESNTLANRLQNIYVLYTHVCICKCRQTLKFTLPAVLLLLLCVSRTLVIHRAPTVGV